MEHIAGRLENRLRNIELVQPDPIAEHGFTQVPNFLFKKSGLSMGAIVVYGKFLSFAWHNDFCFPGQERLADDLDMSVSRINDFIKELEQADLIEIERRGQGKTNLYRIKFVVRPTKKPNS